MESVLGVPEVLLQIKWSADDSAGPRKSLYSSDQFSLALRCQFISVEGWRLQMDREQGTWRWNPDWQERTVIFQVGLSRAALFFFKKTLYFICLCQVLACAFHGIFSCGRVRSGPDQGLDTRPSELGVWSMGWTGKFPVWDILWRLLLRWRNFTQSLVVQGTGDQSCLHEVRTVIQHLILLCRGQKQGSMTQFPK